jgi:hypothetical protein
MTLENAIIFSSKKGNRKGIGKEDNIYFSICLSKNGYNSINFYIGANIARKAKLTEHSKLKFGCDKDDLTIWYLIVSDEGYAVRKDKKGHSFRSLMSFPFEYIDKKMYCVAEKDRAIDTDKRMITLYLDNEFKDKLMLRGL